MVDLTTYKSISHSRMPKRQERNLKFLNFNLSVDAQLPNHGNTQTQQIISKYRIYKLPKTHRRTPKLQERSIELLNFNLCVDAHPAFQPWFGALFTQKVDHVLRNQKCPKVLPLEDDAGPCLIGQHAI